MRAWLVRIHLYIAAFILPIVTAMVVSGGLYLQDIKGQVRVTPIALIEQELSADSPDLKQAFGELLEAQGIDHEFEYVKVSGETLTTRPTSRTYYQLDPAPGGQTLTRQEPDLIKSLVELHKGHGPLLYKDFQKLMAVGLILVLLSGFTLGLNSRAFRMPTIAASLAGLGLLLALALL